MFLHARLMDFNIPQGKYYLANAGFALCDAVLVPYQGVRYHLAEWGQAGVRYVFYKLTSEHTGLISIDQSTRKSFLICDMHRLKTSLNEFLVSIKSDGIFSIVHLSMTCQYRRRYHLGLAPFTTLLWTMMRQTS